MAIFSDSDDETAPGTCHVRIEASDPSQIGEARRAAARLAANCGFPEEECGKAAIIVSELSTNLTRYAVGGEILIHALRNEHGLQLDILAIDRGPGIENLSRSRADGYSTGGTSGNGLGAVERLSTEFDMISRPPAGNVVFSRIAIPADLNARRGFQWACVCRPIPNETSCGDSWSIAEQGDRLSVMLVDGLGHGPLAADAAREGWKAFDHDPFAPLATMFQNAHQRMSGTRGGAMAVAQIDSSAAQLSYLGVGNIAGSLRNANGEEGRGLVSQNGILGSNLRKLQEFQYELPSRGLLVMHSDGLQTRWSLEHFPAVAERHCGVIAGLLYRDFSRGRDDVAVAVIRLPLLY